MPLDAAVQALPSVAVAPAARRSLDPRTRLLLEAPIARTLVRLAWPNIVVMPAQASTGLIETSFVSRLGIDALGISSAIARALEPAQSRSANR